MGLTVAVVCAVLVVVPLVLLAVLASGVVGRAGRLSTRVSGIHTETDTLSSQLTTLQQALAGVRSRERIGEQAHPVD